VIIVSLAGIILESMLMVGALKPGNFGYIRAWFWLGGFTVVFSFLLALSFLMHALDFIYIGENWFFNALCVLADLVFFFVPEYFWGPRLQPVLVALLIVTEFALPILHALSVYVVYSFYKMAQHQQLYNKQYGVELFPPQRQGTPNLPPSCPDGKRSVTPMIEDQVIPYKPKLCQKCACRKMIENGGTGVHGGGHYPHDPLLERTWEKHPLQLGDTPIETTC